MAAVPYNIDASIQAFFKSRQPITRDDCDEHASNVLGSSVRPVEVQGQFSYTVGRDDGAGALLQYRDVSSTMNVENIDKAKQAHEDLVAKVEQLPVLQKESSALNVYKVERKLGALYIMDILRYCSGIDAASEERFATTIRSLARFFAQSLEHPQCLDPAEKDAHRTATIAKLDVLSQTLPKCFQEHIARLRRDLPLIYEDYPFVLSQGDMISTNLIVSQETGSLVSVLDWEEASNQPFGNELYALEEACGNMNSDGWRYFRDDRWAHKLFWGEFWSTQESWSSASLAKLRLARDLGIFLRYGFKWTPDGLRPVSEADGNSMAYLNAFSDGGIEF